MKIDDIYLLYENDGKYFPTYEKAYFYRKSHNRKSVNYVFTPTFEKFSRVGELYHHARQYFNRVDDMDYINVLNNTGFKQIQLF